MSQIYIYLLIFVLLYLLYRNNYNFFDKVSKKFTNKNNPLDKIYIYGDSNARTFINNTIINNKYIIVNKWKSGVTINGLKNINSTSKYLSDILNDLSEIDNKNDIILLQFGQIDIELTYYYKKLIKKENINYTEYINNIIDIYKNFIKTYLNNYNIIVSAINLPSYESDDFFLDYVKKECKDNDNNINNTNIDSVLTLTNKNIEFNKLLQQMTNELNIRFFDISDIFYDQDTNLLNNKYIPIRDHHYIGLSLHEKDNDNLLIKHIYTNELDKFILQE